MKRALLCLIAAVLLCSCSELPTARPAAAPTATMPATSAPAFSTLPAATATPVAPVETQTASPAPTASPASATPSPSPTASASPMPSPGPAASAKPTAKPSAAPAKPADFKMKLPPVLYGVVGREMSLRLDNVVLCSGDYTVRTYGPGALDGRRWSWTPDKAGQSVLTVRAGGRNATVRLKVAAASAGSGLTRKCLFIGDSVTERGQYTAKLLEIQQDDGLKLSLLGSRGKAPDRTEGRAGWKAAYYSAFKSYNGVKNSFYNPSLKRFDFKYYMKNMRYSSVDRVCIALGINDVFAYKDDASLNAEIRRILKRYDAMIKSVHAYSKRITVGIFVTIPPTGAPETFAHDYGRKQSLQRYRRNNFLFMSALVDKYAGQEKNGVYLVPVNAGFDTQYCFGVHPYGAGYGQMAEAVWCWLKNLEK